MSTKDGSRVPLDATLAAAAPVGSWSWAAPGRMIGDFRVLSEIGRGGMGVVFLAEQVSLRRRVALKVMQATRALDEKAVERFRSEIKTLVGMQHSGIVGLIDAGEIDGRPYYAMEFVAGTDLAAVLGKLRENDDRARTPAALRAAIGMVERPSERLTASTGIFAPKRRGESYASLLVAMFADLADALAFVHERGIVHRDIKPANILVDLDGQARLTDFGLSKHALSAGFSATGDLVGTPIYMSPEQVLSGRVPVDQRSDVYSLATTLYEMVSLRPPFAARSMQELFRAIEWDEPLPLRRLCPDLPRDLEVVVAMAMAKNPDRRYQTARDFAEELRRILTFDPVRARRSGRWSRVARKLRKHRLATTLAGVAATLCVLAAVTGWSLWRAEQRSLEAAREQNRQQQLVLLGRSEAALQANELASAASLLASVRVELGPDDRIRTEVDRLNAEIDRRLTVLLADAQVAFDAGKFADAIALLGDYEGTARGEEMRTLRGRAEAALAQSVETAGFRSTTPDERSLALHRYARSWAQRTPPGAAAGAAFLQLLGSEVDVEVFDQALLAAFVSGFDRCEAALRVRFERMEPKFATTILLAAAVAGRGDWVSVLDARLESLVALALTSPANHGWPDLGRQAYRWEVWEFSREQRWSQVSDRLDSLPVLTQRSGGHSSRGAGRSAASDLLDALVLFDHPRATEVARRLLVQLPADDDGWNSIVQTVGEFDDPRLGNEVAALAARLTGPFPTLARLTRLLARWGRSEALAALQRASKAPSGSFEQWYPFDHDEYLVTVQAVVGWLYRDPAVQAWARVRLGDPTERREVVDAIVRGFAAGPPDLWAVTGSVPAIRLVADEVEWPFAPRLFALAGLQSDRQTVFLAISRDLSPTMRERCDDNEIDLPPTVRHVATFLAQPERHLPATLRGLSLAAPDWTDRNAMLALMASPSLAIRREAALALTNSGSARLAKGVLEECAACFGDEPELVRALAIAELEVGATAKAVEHLRALRRAWHLPDEFFAGVQFDRVRAEVVR